MTSFLSPVNQKLRRIRHLSARLIVGRNKGLELVDKSVWQTFRDGSTDLQDYFRSIEAVQGTTSDNFYKQLRFLSMMQWLKLVIESGVTGDFAECGVWRGHSAHIIGTRIRSSGLNRKLHLFDSFEGLSERGEFDLARTEMSDRSKKREQEYFAVGLDVVQANLNEFEFIEFHRGWIPECFEEVRDQKFAFVHLDVDLFEPLAECLEFFAPRLASGGIIVVDDYGHSDFTGAKMAVDNFLATAAGLQKYEVPMGGAAIFRVPNLH